MKTEQLVNMCLRCERCKAIWRYSMWSVRYLLPWVKNALTLECAVIYCGRNFAGGSKKAAGSICKINVKIDAEISSETSTTLYRDKQDHSSYDRILLGSCHQSCKKNTSAECDSRKLLMMGKYVEFVWQNKIWEICASGWFYYKEICYDALSHGRKVISFYPLKYLFLDLS